MNLPVTLTSVVSVLVMLAASVAPLLVHDVSASTSAVLVVVLSGVVKVASIVVAALQPNAAQVKAVKP
jgi:hypothetical protein